MTGTPLVTDAAINPTSDACPRCGGEFHCGVTDPAPCACAGLQLSAETLAGLRQRHDGCLCLACLVHFASPGAATAVDPAEGLPTTDQARALASPPATTSSPALLR